MRLRQAIFCTALVLFASEPARSAAAGEYFVSPGGEDANDGLSRTAPFRSVQRGVDALAPGDTLTVLPGEYRESVRREGLGGPAADTLIRAEIPGTAVLRGDAPAPAFARVPGYRFVYAAAFDGQMQAVLETDTLEILKKQVDVAALEFEPGSFYHEEASRTLYISTSDLLPAGDHHYTVSVNPESGLRLEQPVRVTVEGLAATGFYHARLTGLRFTNYTYGIVLVNPADCTIRRCAAWLNAMGISMIGGRGTLIDRCAAWGNYSKYQAEGGNIVRFNANDDVITNCLAYGSKQSGLRFYGGIDGPVRFENNLAWGNTGGDYWIKGTNREKYGQASGNIGLGEWAVHNVSRSLAGGRNQYNPAMPPDNVSLAGLDQDGEFADPLNLDFRLQGTSRLRGTGPDGGDRGPLPFRTDVFYLKPDGDDGADGLSVARAWRTLDHALARLKGGDTLYLLAGEYAPGTPVTPAAGAGETIRFRARGLDQAVITGPWFIAGGRGLAFERLAFTREVTVTDSDDITFDQCRFSGTGAALSAARTAGLRLTHNWFTGFSVAAVALSGRPAGRPGAFLAGNIFDNARGPALLLDAAQSVDYSDYNAYREPVRAWRTAGRDQDLGAGQPGREAYSRSLTPAFLESGGEIRLKNAALFTAGGPLGKPFGPHPTMPGREIILAGPFVHSAGDTTANIEWWTSAPARCALAWGETPEESETMIAETNGHGSLTLTGLQPGRQYEFRVEAVTPRTRQAFFHETAASGAPFTAGFATSVKTPGVRVFHVAPDGEDANDGLSRATPFRTLNRAAAQVGAGDTVLVAGGTYHETVWMRAGGAPGRPVTWRAAPGEKVVFDGLDRTLSLAFVADGKSDIRFDGFYFVSLGTSGGSGSGAFKLSGCRRLGITRCFMDGRGSGYSPVFVYATNCVDLTLENSVAAGCFYGTHFIRCPGLRVENSVFLRNLIQATVAVNRADEPMVFNRNIIADSLPIKQTIQLFEIPQADSFSQADNCFFLRLPETERQNVFWFYQSDGKLTLPEYFALKGANGSLAADPGFRATLDMAQTGADGKLVFLPDLLVNKRDLDFPDLFATRPDLVERGIGLRPEAFADFHFNR